MTNLTGEAAANRGQTAADPGSEEPGTDALAQTRASQPGFSPQRADRGSVVERRGYVIRRLSVMADVFGLLLTGLLAAAVLKVDGRPLTNLDTFLFLLFIPVWPLIGIAMRAYHPAVVGRGLTITISDEFATIFRVSTMWAWLLLLSRSVASPDPIQMIPSILVWAISIPVILACRSALRQFARSRGWYQQRVFVIGRDCDAEKVVSRIRRHPEWGLIVAEEIDVGNRPNGRWSVDRHVRRVSDVRVDSLLRLTEDTGVSRVIFATPPGQLDARTDLTRAFIESGVQVDFVPGEAEILRSGAVISHLEGLPLMSMPGARPPRSWGVLKRGMDLAIAVPALILTAPVIAYAAIRIKLDSPGPVFYQQTRAGQDGKHFQFLKLRTMFVDADQRIDEVTALSLHPESAETGVFKAADDPRVTSVGRRLRRRSLDELPQLLNVVNGDMSLVGPRPLPVHEDQRVAGHYELRRHVKPGMTGPWQVNGRSDIPFHDMLRLDYSYVLNWSISEDVKLLVQTIDAVTRGRGAY